MGKTRFYVSWKIFEIYKNFLTESGWHKFFPIQILLILSGRCNSYFWEHTAED